MPRGVTARRRHPSIRESLQEYGRGLAGGLLFSLPLLYTMEMWWAGFTTQPHRLLVLVVATYVLLLGYNRFAGLHDDATWTEVAIDSVEELGLGLVTAAAMLFLLGRVGPGTSADEIMGKIIVEASVVAIGFSVGTAQLNAGDENRRSEPRRGGERSQFLRELVIALCGAVLFAANIAPTEEILMIAAETDPGRLLGLAVASLAIGSVILYFSNFRQSHAVVHRDTPFGVVLGSTVTYAVALIASGLTLWFFGRFEGASLEISVSQIVVLGFPSTLGASAGRLLLSS